MQPGDAIEGRGLCEPKAERYYSGPTARKKLHGALQRFRAWIREKYHLRGSQLMREYAAKLRGHYQYYGLSGNGHRLYSYYRQTYRTLYKWLNRRSQKRSHDWPSFERLLRRHRIPAPRLVSARPQQRELSFA